MRMAQKLGLELVIDDMDFDGALHGCAERPERHGSWRALQ